MHLLEPSGTVRLSVGAIGDIGVIGSARQRAQQAGYAHVFAPLAAVLRTADTSFANLEFPVADPRWMRPGRTPAFWHDVEVAAGLAQAGVQVVSLANNHIMDAGVDGLRSTLAACRAAGLHSIGAGMSLGEAREPARFTVRGQRVVFVGYGAADPGDHAREAHPGVAPLDAELIREDLARWRPEADILVVSVHWGSMYVQRPPRRVLELSRTIAGAGADLVLGHHAHVLQGFRLDPHTLTLFGMGDAAFNCRSGELDIEWTREMRSATAAFVAHLADTHGLEAHALRLDDDGLPVAAGPAEAEAIYARLRELSLDWDAADAQFNAEAAPTLLRYEFNALGEYIRRGKILKAARLLLSVRPRHFRMLLRGMRGSRR